MSESVRKWGMGLPVEAAYKVRIGNLSQRLKALSIGLILREILWRLISFFACGYFALGAAIAYVQEPTRVSLLGLLLTESLNIALVLFSALPRYRDWHIAAILTATYASIFPVFLDVQPGTILAPWAVTTALAVAGLCLNFWAKLTLGSSFAILPGLRTVVDTGPYRFVRHPVYAGFIMVSLSFLLHDFNISNMILLATAFGCELYRIGREETVLLRDTAYHRYMQVVRYRFIPGLV